MHSCMATLLQPCIACRLEPRQGLFAQAACCATSRAAPPGRFAAWWVSHLLFLLLSKVMPTNLCRLTATGGWTCGAAAWCGPSSTSTRPTAPAALNLWCLPPSQTPSSPSRRVQQNKNICNVDVRMCCLRACAAVGYGDCAAPSTPPPYCCQPELQSYLLTTCRWSLARRPPSASCYLAVLTAGHLML